eukprot:gene7022-7236_t
MNSRAVLAHCTHYGGSEVHIIGASSKGVGAAAFTQAFPRLQVFSCLPATIKVAAELKHHGKWNITSAELLSMCRKVRAVCGYGGQAARCFAANDTLAHNDKQAGHLQRLVAVSLHCSMSSSATLSGLPQLRGLTRLELLLSAPTWPLPYFESTIPEGHADPGEAVDPPAMSADPWLAGSIALHHLLQPGAWSSSSAHATAEINTTPGLQGKGCAPPWHQ